MASAKQIKTFVDLLKTLTEREASTGLKGLQLFKPVEYLDQTARRYGSGSPSALDVIAAPRQIETVGNWYANAPMVDAGAEAAYRAMAEDTARQFDMLTSPAGRGGLGVDVSVTDIDPYDTSKIEGVRRMIDDMNNRRLAVLSTQTTGGHPFFTNDQNDMFRAVHDAFGHGATGRGFNRHGEEAAYRSHARMYSPEARPALASETRAQNAYVNQFGDFGPQKMVTLPNELAALEAFDLPPDVKYQIMLNTLAKMGAIQ